MSANLHSKCPMGEPLPKNAAGKEAAMSKKLLLTLATVAALSAVFVGDALAVTVPAVPVSEYGNSLLTAIADVLGDILPYAAAITAFAIGVGMLKRWLGHRKATRV